MQAKDLFIPIWKPAAVILGVAIIGGLLGTADIQSGGLGGPLPFFRSATGILLILILHLGGLIYLGYRNPRGWAWLATSFYLLCFSTAGISSWVLLGIAISCIWTYFQWKKPKTA